MQRQTLRTLTLTLVAALALPLAARADPISVTLAQSLQTVAPGTTVVPFFATLMNPSTDTIYFNGDSPTSPSPDLSIDDSNYINNFVLAGAPLGPSASTGSIELFDVDLDPTTPAGDYVFTDGLVLNGGADGGAGSAFDDLANISFEVDVEAPSQSTVPEPAPLLLLASGLALLAAAAFLKRKASGWQR